MSVAAIPAGPEALQTILDRGEPILAPGAINALAARMIEDAGFELVYATGGGISNAFVGVPDLGIMTMDEMFAHVRAMVEVLGIPLIVDIDTGYGGVHNVQRAIRQCEMYGVAAVQIEDQVFPKRCGHFRDKQVVAPSAMIEKLLAAVDARRHGIRIIARTDALAVEGFGAAMQRAQAYKDAGADILFVEALRSESEIRTAAQEVEGPKVINMVEGGVTPLLDLETLGGLGYSIVAHANFGLRAMMKSLKEALDALRVAGTSADLLDRIVGWDERQETVALSDYDNQQDRWATQAASIAESMGDPDAG